MALSYGTTLSNVRRTPNRIVRINICAQRRHEHRHTHTDIHNPTEKQEQTTSKQKTRQKTATSTDDAGKPKKNTRVKTKGEHREDKEPKIGKVGKRDVR